MSNAIKAVVFDLDGVITDTAEFHYQAWQRLADEEGIPFTRADNEFLRGVSRSESLQLLLQGRPVDDVTRQAMMDRKNAYFQELLERLTPRDLLPGVADLFNLLDQANVRFGIASASRNARTAVEKLGIDGRLAVLVDGTAWLARNPPGPVPTCGSAPGRAAGGVSRGGRRGGGHRSGDPGRDALSGAGTGRALRGDRAALWPGLAPRRPERDRAARHRSGGPAREHLVGHSGGLAGGAPAPPGDDFHDRQRLLLQPWQP